MNEQLFQQRVQPWMMECFGPTISADRQERNHRFIEEALELAQACGATQSEAHQLVDYVYGRPVGEPAQEVGGVMVTLAALCLANGLDMHAAGEIELARIWTKVEQIRAKQAAKPKHSPLPGAPAQPETWKALPSQAATDPIRDLIAMHAEMKEANAYCYFELAYTRNTDWMAFICDRPAGGTVGTPEFGAGRKILAQGQGQTPEDACLHAARCLAESRTPAGESLQKAKE